MKRFTRIIGMVLAASLCMGVFALAGCISNPLQQQMAAETSAASANRNFMATLNRQTADLQKALDEFQQAVADDNAVTMQAQLKAVDQIIDAVKNTSPTDTLRAVKDGYVDALTALDSALDDYADLYAQVKSGAIDSAAFNERLAAVQKAYDEGIEKMKAADQAVKDVSHE